MDSGATRIFSARSAFFSFTQKEIGRTSILKSCFNGFLRIPASSYVSGLVRSDVALARNISCPTCDSTPPVLGCVIGATA